MSRQRGIQLLACAAIVGIAAAAMARPGRVVRVERRSATASKPLALCTWMGRDLTCFTGEPETGDQLEIVDENGAYQRVEITRLKPNQMACGPSRIVDAETRTLAKRAPANQSLRRGSAFGGLTLTPGRSRLLDANRVKRPSGASGPARIALDITGDGRAELIITAHDCPATRRNVPGLSGKSNVQSICVGTWRRNPLSTKWTQVGDKAIHICP